MAEIQQLLEGKVKARADFLVQHLEPTERNFNNFIKDFESYAKTLIRAKKTGNFKPVASKKIKMRESLKENTLPKSDAEKNKKYYKNNIDVINVKTEKLSILTPTAKNVDSEEMPAPKMLPPKRKVKKEKESINIKATRGYDTSESKRSTRSRTTNADRNSDVVLQTIPVPLVDLSDSEDEIKPVVVRSTRTRTKKNGVWEESTSTSVRSTRTRTKNKTKLEDDSQSRSANVVDQLTINSASGDEQQISWQSGNINIIKDLKTDNDVSDPLKQLTKSKTKPKRERSKSEEQDARSNNHKRSKSNTRSDNEGANISGRTEYEDAVSEIGPNLTFVKPAETTEDRQTSYEQVVNETVILEDRTKAPPDFTDHIDVILTDDESFEDLRKLSPQKGKKAKEVFSPYVTSPVKKKVEAFERFQHNDTSETSSKANTSRILREIEEKKGNVKEKAKGFTPISSKTLYKNGPSSASKICKYVSNKTTFNDSMSFSKTTPLKSSGLAKSTPLKTLQPIKVASDYRQKEIKRQERETELKKKEIMKRAASVDRKKKYEEKMLKVQQQQKEALEKEKLKALEVQRLKEERYKLLVQQKEEKQKQLKEENERKRLLAKQRADEKRKEEEYQQMLANQEKLKNEHSMRKNAEAENLRKKAMQNSVETLPVFMTRPAPYLHCNDCYDSDDEEYTDKRKIPEWASKQSKYETDYLQTTLGHKIKNTFFCCQNHTVDLKEIFVRIDPRKLKRTSSAYWAKPPRFTMLPDCL